MDNVFNKFLFDICKYIGSLQYTFYANTQISTTLYNLLMTNILSIVQILSLQYNFLLLILQIEK